MLNRLNNLKKAVSFCCEMRFSPLFSYALTEMSAKCQQGRGQKFSNFVSAD